MTKQRKTGFYHNASLLAPLVLFYVSLCVLFVIMSVYCVLVLFSQRIGWVLFLCVLLCVYLLVLFVHEPLETCISHLL